MLTKVCNVQKLDNKRLLARALAVLAQKLPAGWTVKVVGNGGVKSDSSEQICMSASRREESTVNAVLGQSMRRLT
jgi:hypothetical protein